MKLNKKIFSYFNKHGATTVSYTHLTLPTT